MTHPPSAAPPLGIHGETAAPPAMTPVAGCSYATWTTSVARTPDVAPASVGPCVAPGVCRHQDQHRPRRGPTTHPASGPGQPLPRTTPTADDHGRQPETCRPPRATMAEFPRDARRTAWAASSSLVWPARLPRYR